MLTINITNSTVTIVANGENIEVKTDKRATKDKGPFENRCGETPMPEKTTPNESLAASFIPVDEPAAQSAVMGVYTDLFNKTRQDMQNLWYSQAITMPTQPFLSGVYIPQTSNHMYQPPQINPQHTPPQRPYYPPAQAQQGNTFASYPVTVDNFTPHYDKSVRASITSRMVLHALKYVPNSKIGMSTRGSIAIKEINDTGLTTHTVELDFLEGTPIGWTVFVKGHNTNRHEYVYNSWTKVEDNGWKVNATVYEPFVSSLPSNLQQMQTPNVHRPMQPIPYPQSVSKPAEPEQTPVKPAQTLTDRQLVDTLKTLPETCLTYIDSRDARRFKYNISPELTTKTVTTDRIEIVAVGEVFLTLVSDSGARNKVYLCWTKVASNTWTLSLEIENLTGYLDGAIEGLKDATVKLAKHAVTDKSSEPKPFDVSTAGLVSFLSEIKNPEKWEVAYIAFDFSDSLTLRSHQVITSELNPAVVLTSMHRFKRGLSMWVVPVGSLSLTPEEQGEMPNKLGTYSIAYKQVNADQSYCRCVRVGEDTWTVYKTQTPRKVEYSLTHQSNT